MSEFRFDIRNSDTETRNKTGDFGEAVEYADQLAKDYGSAVVVYKLTPVRVYTAVRPVAVTRKGEGE